MKPLSTTQRQSQNHPPSDSGLAQSAAYIPLYYDRLLGEATAAADPFYALGDLFNFAATSEAQFLNMIEKKTYAEMSQNMNETEKKDHSQHAWTLSNLFSAKSVLDSHIGRLKENVISIKNRGGFHRTKGVDDDKQRLEIDTAADALLTDFKYLLEKAQKLFDACGRKQRHDSGIQACF